MTLSLRLNPALSADDYAEAYARDRLVQIPGILEEPVAEALHDILVHHTPWRLVHAAGADAPQYLTVDQIRALGPAGNRDLHQRVMADARDNLGYLYNVYPMILAYLQGWDPGHPLHRVTEFLQSEEVRAFGRRVVGCDRVTKVDAQATLYAPGHFLTRHEDSGENNQRRAAYTLGLSKGWEPDWGGLLAFLTPALDVESAWTPRWNTLTLFDGTRLHAVTQVSAFAGAGRYSITGWLRDDPPAGSPR